jgi:hypothetical protein
MLLLRTPSARFEARACEGEKKAALSAAFGNLRDTRGVAKSYLEGGVVGLGASGLGAAGLGTVVPVAAGAGTPDCTL